MDDRRLDDLARALAERRSSRRSIARAILGSAVAGLAGVLTGGRRGVRAQVRCRTLNQSCSRTGGTADCCERLECVPARPGTNAGTCRRAACPTGERLGSDRQCRCDAATCPRTTGGDNRNCFCAVTTEGSTRCGNSGVCEQAQSCRTSAGCRERFGPGFFCFAVDAPLNPCERSICVPPCGTGFGPLATAADGGAQTRYGGG